MVKTFAIPAGSKLTVNGEVVATLTDDTSLKAFKTGGFVTDPSVLKEGLKSPAIVASGRYVQLFGRAFSNSPNLDPAYRAVLETHIAYWSTETIFSSSFMHGLVFYPGDDAMTGWGCSKHDAFIDLCGRLGAV